MVVKIKKINYIIGVFLISFSLSPLCVLLTTKFLPFNISEIFLFPGFYLVLNSNREIRRTFLRNLRNNRYIITVFFLFFFFIIGIITGENIGYVYGDLRTILIFTFFFLMTIKERLNQEIVKKFIYNVFIALTFIDVLYLLLKSSYFLIESERAIVMTICPFVVSIFFLNKNSFIFSFIFFLILCYETLVSSMRINYILIIFYIIYIMVLFFSSLKNKKISFTKIILFIFIVIFMSIELAPRITNYIVSNGSRYVHTVKRTEQLYDNPMESELTRFNSTFIFFYEPQEFLFPQGLGWRNHISRIQSLFRVKYDILSTMDSNIFYSVYHFGLIIGLIFILFLFLSFFILIFKVWRSCKFIGFIYYSLLVGVIMTMFILKSWMFVYLNFGLIYSMLFILIKYPDSELKKSEF